MCKIARNWPVAGSYFQLCNTNPFINSFPIRVPKDLKEIKVLEVSMASQEDLDNLVLKDPRATLA